MRNIKYAFIVLMTLALWACASSSPFSEPAALSSPDQARPLLERYYQVWKGTPYRYGGTSRRGIDCSAFVQQLYQTVYGIQIPRATRQQKGWGQPVQTPFKTGDLVLFKIPGKSNHIGVYLEQNRFVHASSSKGVVISSLDNPYWRKHFWQARRSYR